MNFILNSFVYLFSAQFVILSAIRTNSLYYSYRFRPVR